MKSPKEFVLTEEQEREIAEKDRQQIDGFYRNAVEDEDDNGEQTMNDSEGER